MLSGCFLIVSECNRENTSAHEGNLASIYKTAKNPIVRSQGAVNKGTSANAFRDRPTRLLIHFATHIEAVTPNYVNG